MSGKRKLPDHVHCAKCGYRGINQEHDCTKVRAAAAAVVDQAARREEALRLVLPGPPPPDHDEDPPPPTMADLEAPLPLATRLIRLAIEHGRQFGRSLTYVETHRVGNANGTFPVIEIKQRCVCCCSDVDKRIALDVEKPFFGLELGAAARKAYLLHRCPPLSDSLIGFTYEELEQLKQDLERDGQRLFERAAEIVKLEKARAR